VSENGNVCVIVPDSFTMQDVEVLVHKKKKWLENQLNYFGRKAKIELGRNQLLLFGNRYNYFYDGACRRKVVINHEHKTICSAKNLLDKEVQEKWYKSIAKKQLTKRIKELANNLGFVYQRLYIRSQKKKLGNCSKDKNISLNWRLIKAPNVVIDYLIVHELVHTKVMNHSTSFWTLLKSVYPDYKDAIAWMDKYGNGL
jgi:predicted metal-dependent hydrolase